LSTALSLKISDFNIHFDLLSQVTQYQGYKLWSAAKYSLGMSKEVVGQLSSSANY